MPATKKINNILDEDCSNTEKKLLQSPNIDESIIYHSIQGKTKELG